MNAEIVEAASITLPLLGSGLTEDGMAEDPEVSGAVRGALTALHEAVAGRTEKASP